jgi:hypothetical protein
LNVTNSITNSIPLSFHTSLDSLILSQLVFPFVSLDPRDAPLRSCLFYGAANGALQPSIRFRINSSAFRPTLLHFVPLEKQSGGRQVFN